MSHTRTEDRRRILLWCLASCEISIYRCGTAGHEIRAKRPTQLRNISEAQA